MKRMLIWLTKKICISEDNREYSNAVLNNNALLGNYLVVHSNVVQGSHQKVDIEILNYRKKGVPHFEMITRSSWISMANTTINQDFQI